MLSTCNPAVLLGFIRDVFCWAGFLLMKHLRNQCHQLLQPHQLLLHLNFLLNGREKKVDNNEKVDIGQQKLSST